MEDKYKNRVIVAGGRDFEDYRLMEKTLDKLLFNLDPYQLLIISGAAKGADTLAIDYAKQQGFPVQEFPADWKTFGKRAGHLRNEQMAKVATHAVLFWDGNSRGTKNMLDNCVKYKLNYRVIRYGE